MKENKIKETSNSKSASASENVVTARKSKKTRTSMFEVVVNKPEKRISNTGINGEEAPTKEWKNEGLSVLILPLRPPLMLIRYSPFSIYHKQLNYRKHNLVYMRYLDLPCNIFGCMFSSIYIPYVTSDLN